MLHENLRLAKENNRLLNKLYKYQQFQRITRFLYWIAVAALALGAYYYAKPYIDNVRNAYTSIQETVGGVQNVFGGMKFMQ